MLVYAFGPEYMVLGKKRPEKSRNVWEARIVDFRNLQSQGFFFQPHLFVYLCISSYCVYHVEHYLPLFMIFFSECIMVPKSLMFASN